MTRLKIALFLLRFALIFLFLELDSTCRADQADSLLHELKSAPNDAVFQLIESEIGAARYDLAENYCRAIIEQAEYLEDDSLRFLVYTNLGNIAQHQGNYTAAAAEYIKVLDWAESNSDTAWTIGCLSNLGSLHASMLEWDDALKYFRRSYDIIKKQGVVPLEGSEITLCANLGVINSRLEKYDVAYLWMKKALHLAKKQEQHQYFGPIYSTLGLIFRFRNELDSADFYYRRCLDLCSDGENIPFEIASYQNIAGVFDLRGKHDSALYYLNVGLIKAKKSQQKRLEEELLNGIAQNYRQLGQDDSAYVYLHRRYSLRESLYAEHKKDLLLELEQKYEKEKRLREIASLERVNKEKELVLANNKLVIVGLVSLLLMLLLVSLFYHYRTRLRTISRVAELKQIALRAQMNPHFLFNALGSIQNSILKNDKISASEFLAKFAKLTRMILVRSGEDEIPLTEELRMLELYLALEQFRSGQ